VQARKQQPTKSSEAPKARVLTEEEAEGADEVLVADDDGHGRGDREAQRAGDAHPGTRAVRHLLLLPADGGRRLPCWCGSSHEPMSERSPRAIPRYAVNLDASPRPQGSRAHVLSSLGWAGGVDIAAAHGAERLQLRGTASSGINAGHATCVSVDQKENTRCSGAVPRLERARIESKLVDCSSHDQFLTSGEMVRASLQESIVDLAVLSARDV